jgi:peptidoglycan-N-acetylglucosamine deacetylase
LGEVLKSIQRLPWLYVVAFNMAALLALALAILLQFTQPIPRKPEAPATKQNVSGKRIAFSFDDVPRAPGAFLDPMQRPALMIKALQAGKIRQAAFFANPGRISPINKGAETIAAYAKAGHVIGNHTQSHKPLSKVSAAFFLSDIDKAEDWLRQQRNYRPWFRFPQLDEGGRDKIKRNTVRAGLKQRGIRNAYVTADGWDWYMERQAVAAKRAGKTMDMNALRDLFVETHVESAEFSDRLAQRMFNRSPVQMMLLHETDLSAMYIDDLANALRAKGWQIVSADSVYADPMARIDPNPDVANGTWLEILAWEKKVVGERWFPRNDTVIAKKLFTERVLHE